MDDVGKADVHAIHEALRAGKSVTRGTLNENQWQTLLSHTIAVYF